MLSMLATAKYWERACAALGAPELASGTDFDSDEKRSARSSEIRARLEKSIGSEPVAHWEQRLRAAGCIYSKFASPSEVLDDPQVEANGYAPAHPSHATARLAASPVQFDAEPIEVRRAAPERGEHTDEILETIGVGSEQRDALKKSGAIA
jgi:crotonobetainyl-CoA:carnitine CoA-transferase CaiB-like acyl-CoA transferase